MGDRRPYLAALITLDPEETAALAAELGIEDPRDLPDDERVHAEVQKVVDEVNSHVGPSSRSSASRSCRRTSPRRPGSSRRP